jgi:hypothetical protein
MDLRKENPEIEDDNEDKLSNPDLEAQDTAENSKVENEFLVN